MSQSEVLRKLWQLHNHGRCSCGALFSKSSTNRCSSCRRGKWKVISDSLGVDYYNLSKVLRGKLHPGPKLLKALYPDRQVERQYVTKVPFTSRTSVRENINTQK